MRNEYPEGKKYEDDEGALEIKIAADHKRKVVRIDFGKPVQWIALEPIYVVRFCELLAKRAKELV